MSDVGSTFRVLNVEICGSRVEIEYSKVISFASFTKEYRMMSIHSIARGLSIVKGTAIVSCERCVYSILVEEIGYSFSESPNSSGACIISGRDGDGVLEDEEIVIKEQVGCVVNAFFQGCGHAKGEILAWQR